MSQIVYILTNEAMPDLIKIGMTDRDIEQRVQELGRATGVPLPFEVYYACEVNDMSVVEKALHDAFLDHRINPKKEFFRINPERVVSVLRLLERRDVTPVVDVLENVEEENALQIEKERRARFNFKFVDLPAGSVLHYLYDDTVTCTVAGEREVEWNGEISSINQLTLRLLKDSGRIWKAVQGPAFWKYEGETLDDRRRRMEQ